MIDPLTLNDVRLQAHWAAQLAATVGRTLAKPRPDDSHASFRWIDDRDALVQEDGHHSGLRLRDLTLLLGNDALPLHGTTIDEAFAWIEQRAPGVRKELDSPMPHHAVASGAAFDVSDRARFEELARCYREANALLREVQDDVRTWQHHFDIATLLEFDGGTKTIGAGLSPGDESIPQPYWYVNHSPLGSTTRTFPPLGGGGTWNTEGWIGAILPASRRGDPRAFLESAIDASRGLLGV